MDVDIPLLEHLAVDAQLLVVSLDPLISNRCRLLHHIAKVTREVELALAWCEDRLHVEDVATNLSPCKTCNHAAHASDIVAVVAELRLAEHLLDALLAHCSGVVVAEGYCLSTVACHLGNHLVECAHARFAGVVLDDLHDSIVGDVELLLGDAMCLALLGDKVLACNLRLIFENIAGDVDHLHTIAQSG